MNILSRVQQILLQATIFLVPFGGYSYISYPFSLSITNIVLLSASIMTFIQISLNKEKIAISPEHLICIILFVFVLFYSSLANSLTGGSSRHVITMLGFLIIFSLIPLIVQQRKQINHILHFIFLSSLLIALLSITSSLTGISFGGSFHSPRSILGFQIPLVRTAGIDLSHGEFGMMTAGALPFAITKGIRERNALYLLGSGIILFCIVFVLQSRSTWLAAFTSLGILFYLFIFKDDTESSWNTTKKLFQCSGILAVPILFLGLLYVIVSIGESIGIRLVQIFTASELILERPVVGYGFSNITQFFPRNTFPHNAFFRYGMASGIIPLLTLLSIFSILIKMGLTSLSNSSGEDYMVTAIIFSGFMAAFIEANLLVDFGKVTWMWAALLVANSGSKN